MARLLFALLAAATYPVLLHGFKQTIYKIYKPEICDKLCDDSINTSICTSVEFSCRRIAKNDPEMNQLHRSGTCVIRMARPRHDRMQGDSEGEAAPKTPRLQAESATKMPHLQAGSGTKSSQLQTGSGTKTSQLQTGSGTKTSQLRTGSGTKTSRLQAGSGTKTSRLQAGSGTTTPRSQAKSGTKTSQLQARSGTNTFLLQAGSGTKTSRLPGETKTNTHQLQAESATKTSRPQAGSGTTTPRSQAKSETKTSRLQAGSGTNSSLLQAGSGTKTSRPQAGSGTTKPHSQAKSETKTSRLQAGSGTNTSQPQTEYGTKTPRLQEETKTNTHQLQEESTEYVSSPDNLVQYNHNITLHDACRQGNIGVVKFILSHGLEDINCRHQRGGTPVMAAAGNGQGAVFDFLVSQGCDLAVVNNDNNTVLHVACQNNQSNITGKLVDDLKYDINIRGWNNWTPVMYAIYFGNKGAVELFVSKGCDLTLVSDINEDVLHVACMGGYVDMVTYVLTKDIFSVDSRDLYRRTPVFKAVAKGHKRVIDLLTGKGCNPKAIDIFENNILHTACANDNVHIVEYIIKLNIVGIDDAGNLERTAVMIAAQWGHVRVVGFLISKGCNVSATDNYGNNILHIACMYGQVDMVKYIINQHIVGIDSRGFRGRTASVTAAKWGHAPVVEFLIKEGCNTRAIDNDKNNILHIVCITGSIDMVKFLIKRNIVDTDSRGSLGRTPVMFAAEHGKKRVVDFLVRKGCNLLAVDNNKNTILHVACVGGHMDMVKYIITKHIVSLEARGFYGRTPVMTAADMGHTRVVDLLVRRGCDMKTLDDGGNNILHVACIRGDVDLVRYLFRLGALSRKQINKYGMTPEQVAKIRGHEKIVSLLKAGK